MDVYEDSLSVPLCFQKKNQWQNKKKPTAKQKKTIKTNSSKDIMGLKIINQALVVRKMNNAIHWINLNLLESTICYIT